MAPLDLRGWGRVILALMGQPERSDDVQLRFPSYRLLLPAGWTQMPVQAKLKWLAETVDELIEITATAERKAELDEVS
jgi:hypothetical protein